MILKKLVNLGLTEKQARNFIKNHGKERSRFFINHCQTLNKAGIVLDNAFLIYVSNIRSL